MRARSRRRGRPRGAGEGRWGAQGQEAEFNPLSAYFFVALRSWIDGGEALLKLREVSLWNTNNPEKQTVSIVSININR